MGTLAGQTAFYYLAAASIASAGLAITRSNPIHSMLWVLALFLHVAGIFVLVGAQFLAAVQVIVYAGAILVFYLFFRHAARSAERDGGAPFRRPLAAGRGRRGGLRLPCWCAGTNRDWRRPRRRRPLKLRRWRTSRPSEWRSSPSLRCPSRSCRWSSWWPSSAL